MSRAGTGLLVDTVDVLGVRQALQAAVGDRRPSALLLPGWVVADLAIMLADGGTRLRHLDVLRGQPALFGTVASVPTASRTIAALADTDVGGAVAALDTARAAIRARAWELGAEPAVVAAAREGKEKVGPLPIDIDATILIAHSDGKDGAAKTYKRSWGFQPMLAWLDRGDGTGEALAGQLRPGNAGPNSAADQIAIVDRALAQLPGLPDQLDLLIRADTAGAVHDLLDHIRNISVGTGRTIRFSVGMPLHATIRTVIAGLDEHDDRWTQAIRQNGKPRTGAAVAEIGDLVDLDSWPAGARLIVRREPLHPGAQQTFDDIDGYRFTAFLTDQPDHDIAELDRRHRAHARVEDRIRGAKNTGLAAMVCDTFNRNQIWLQTILAACDLTVFMQTLALTGRHAIAEPKLLRYQLFHVAGRIARTSRQTFLRLQADWPYTHILLAAFRRLRNLPVPAG